MQINPILSEPELPYGATFDPDTGEFTWIPQVGQAGTYHIRFGVTDGELEDYEDVIIMVEPAEPSGEGSPAPPPAGGGDSPPAPLEGGASDNPTEVYLSTPPGVIAARSVLNTVVGVIVVGGILITSIKAQSWQLLMAWLAGGLIAKLTGDILIGSLF